MVVPTSFEPYDESQSDESLSNLAGHPKESALDVTKQVLSFSMDMVLGN